MVLESVVFPVTYLNVSTDLALQQLLVEWDVGKAAHDAELAMSFEIQVRQTQENTTLWTVSVYVDIYRYISYLQYKGSQRKTKCPDAYAESFALYVYSIVKLY